MSGTEEAWRRKARENERDVARQKKFAMWAIPIVVVSVGAGAVVDRCNTEDAPTIEYVEKYPYQGPGTTTPAQPAYENVRPSGPSCTKGCRCGNSCIDCSKTCRH